MGIKGLGAPFKHINLTPYSEKQFLDMLPHVTLFLPSDIPLDYNSIHRHLIAKLFALSTGLGCSRHRVRHATSMVQVLLRVIARAQALVVRGALEIVVYSQP